MWTRFNIFKISKILLMVFAVVFMLTACNGNDHENTAQAPLASGSEGQASSQLASTISAMYRSCWQSKIISYLYSTMGSVAISSYTKMTGGALALMMVAFAIWLSVKLLKQLSSFKEEEMGKTWNEIAKMFFMCLVCGLIASQSSLLLYVLGNIIFPVYNAFLEFASELMNTSINVSKLPNTVSFGGFTETYSLTVSCKAGNLSSITANSSGFPDSPGRMMECMVCAMNERLSFAAPLAFAMMSGSNFMAYVVAFFVLASFLFVKIGFVFYLIDSIFRFTLMVVMLPIMIMAYPFEKSRGLLSKGIKNMLNSAAFMMFFALVIAVSIVALASLLNFYKGDFASKASFEDLSVIFLCIMLIAFLVSSSLKVAGEMASAFVGGKSSQRFQKDAIQVINGAVSWVTSFGAKLAETVLPKQFAKDVQDVMKQVKSAIKGH